MRTIKVLFISLLVSSFMMFLPYKVGAEEYPLDYYYTNEQEYSSRIGNGEYTLTKYDIKIIVNENNTFNITENISAYFNVQKHGIFRRIPLRNTVTRLDGTTSKNRAKISDLKVSETYSLSTENGYRVIKIGNPNYTLIGSRDYEISYLYNIGKDPIKDYDELYLNLIGNEWDTTISGITFTIVMPKEFDKNKLGFSRGELGSTNSSGIIYTVKENIITGSYEGTLNKGEALTVRLELPEGYFVGAGLGVDYFVIFAILIPILFVVITFFMWKKYGKDNPVIETVEFYPPEGFNSAEVGFLYKGHADNQDVVSLLIYLANKGYIKITESEEKAFFSKNKGFKIIKIKDYDGNDINERLFLKGLFKDKRSSRISFSALKEAFKNPSAYAEKMANESEISKEEVTWTDLYNSFYKTLNAIVTNINSKENKRKIFEKNSLNKGFIISLMMIIIFLLITVKPVIDFGEIFSLPFVLIFPLIGFSIFATMIFGNDKGAIHFNGKPSGFKTILIIIEIIFGFMFGIVPLLIFMLPVLLVEPIYLAVYIIGFFCIVALFILKKYMPKRTAYGNELLGKIKGFKNFLETVEKPKLEELVMQDPSYFYNILPYTYVLGVSDKWISKFETISLQAPNWYDGSDTFNTVSFGNFMNNTMTSASSAMASSPSGDSSSGGSSGGGSSGGGSGGGGGGSW